MILTIVFILLVGVGVIMRVIPERSFLGDRHILAEILICIFSLFLMINTLYIAVASYEFKIFKVKREAFENSLEESRRANRDLESAAILKEVSNWNMELAERQYKNTLVFFDWYIDDRIDELEPIK